MRIFHENGSKTEGVVAGLVYISLLGTGPFFFIGFRTLRIFLDLKLNLATFAEEGGKSACR